MIDTVHVAVSLLFHCRARLLQDGLTGSAWGDWANYTDSPLRAFEDELGVQAPVGFWDPVGYTRDGDAETFKRRRETEIKHGRVAMYAPGSESCTSCLVFNVFKRSIGAWCRMLICFAQYHNMVILY